MSDVIEEWKVDPEEIYAADAWGNEVSCAPGTSCFLVTMPGDEGGAVYLPVELVVSMLQRRGYRVEHITAEV